MKRLRFLFALFVLLSFTRSEAADARPKLLSWSELSAMPLPAKRITYSSGPQQFGELRRQLLPLGVPQIFIQGEADPIVDPGSVRAHVEAAKKMGDHAVVLPLPNAGHFEASV